MFFKLILGGAVAYIAIPREALPEVTIPQIEVSARLDGATPADAEQLIVVPLESELSALEGLERMSATAAEGSGSVVLEFLPGFDAEQALADVRAAVARARPELPDGVTEPVVRARSSAGPFMFLTVAGPVPERTLVRLAEDLGDRIEGVPGVLSVNVGGVRDEVVEALIDPAQVASYGITLDEVLGQVSANNRVVTAGTLGSPAGDFALRVPGLIDDLDDVAALPVRVVGDRVISIGELALLRRGFEDRQSGVRANGQPSLVLSVTKRDGANIVETAAQTRAVIAETAACGWLRKCAHSW
jgi:multidrug efflux pump